MKSYHVKRERKYNGAGNAKSTADSRGAMHLDCPGARCGIILKYINILWKNVATIIFLFTRVALPSDGESQRRAPTPTPRAHLSITLPLRRGLARK